MELGDRELVKVGEGVDLPLTGALPFGIIDRGTNLLQIRPVSGCNLCCPFCSVDEGPVGNKAARYQVSPDYMIEYAGAMVERKDSDRIEMHIDGCGEPLLYPELVELVGGLSDMEDVDVVSMQTNGTLLDEDKVQELERAGLDRINLTVNALYPDIARRLAGRKDYGIDSVCRTAEEIAASGTDLLLAPVWIEGVNDGEIPRIIDFAEEVGAGVKFPPLGIQKYREHKNGRKVEGSKEVPWNRFYRKLRTLEREKQIKLRLKPRDFGIRKTGFALPKVFEMRQKVGAKVAAQGWNPGQKMAVAKHRTITVVNGKDIPVGSEVTLEILRKRHNLYLGRAV